MMGLKIDYVCDGDDVAIYAGVIGSEKDLKDYVYGGLDLISRKTDVHTFYSGLGLRRPINKVGFLFRLKEVCEQACLLDSEKFDDLSDFTIGFNWAIDNAESKKGEVLRLNFCKTHSSKFTGKPRIFANFQFYEDIVSTKLDFVTRKEGDIFGDVLKYTENIIERICSLRIASTITGQNQDVEPYNKKVLTNIDTKEKFIEFVREGLPLRWVEHQEFSGEKAGDQFTRETEGHSLFSIEVESRYILLRRLNYLITNEILPLKGIPKTDKAKLITGNSLSNCFDVNPDFCFWYKDNSPFEIIFWIGDWRVIAHFPNRPEDYLKWISEEMEITDKNE